ncbi:MAG: hypothetical protein ACRC6O_13450 [Flavobacterium sp.]
MSDWTYNNGYFRRPRLERVPIEKVEKLRQEFGLKYFQMAKLLGLTQKHYSRCRDKGEVVAFRYYAARDALDCSLFDRVKDMLEQSKRIKD